MFKKIKHINLVRLLKLDRFKTSVIIVLAIGVFVVVNFFLSPISLRLDFSFGQAYTLSNSTKKLIKNLNNGITIKLFASSDLPTRILPAKNEVVDLLNEYKKINSGKVTVKILDPKKDQNALKDAQDLGIPELQFSQMEQDKYAVSSSYFGLAVSNKDKKEILPQISNVESLEYNLTAMIYKLNQKELIKIGMVGKGGSYDPKTDDTNMLKQVFGQQFELTYIDLAIQKEINNSYKTVLLFDDNKTEFTEDEIIALKKYLENKGKIIVFANGVWVEDTLSVTQAKNNLGNLLKEYGLNLQSNLVLSTNAEIVNFGNSMTQFLSAYPFWLRTNTFNTKTSYFSNINQLTFPWVSSVNLEKIPDYDTKEIVSTTIRSWQQKEASGSAFILDPQAIPRPTNKDMKSFVLVAESKKKDGGTIMLIASSRFILNQFLSKTSNNLEFTLNVMNDYASDGVLSGIRQRVVSFYPLPEINTNEKDVFKYANILILPVLFGLLGGIILFKRK